MHFDESIYQTDRRIYKMMENILKGNNHVLVIKWKKYHTVLTVLKYHTVLTVPKYHTVLTVLKSNRKLTERGKMDTPIT